MFRAIKSILKLLSLEVSKQAEISRVKQCNFDVHTHGVTATGHSLLEHRFSPLPKTYSYSQVPC